MGPSAESAPGGVLTPFQEGLRRLAAEVVNTHRHCDVGNLQKCDLYHHLIEIMEKLADDVRQAEQAPMICGHPAACAGLDGCSGCAREQRLLAEARGLS